MSKLFKTAPKHEALTEQEFDLAISDKEPLRTLVMAHVRNLNSIRRRGRPAAAPKHRKVVQRRGRKATKKISPLSSNVQLAKLASVYQSILGKKTKMIDAVRTMLLEIGENHSESDARKIAKLASELDAIERDKTIRAKKTAPITTNIDNSLLGQLQRASSKGF
jgi:hypothetical protein